jgi:hypothetical protein
LLLPRVPEVLDPLLRPVPPSSALLPAPMLLEALLPMWVLSLLPEVAPRLP